MNNLLIISTKQKGKCALSLYLTMNSYLLQIKLKFVIFVFLTKQDDICDYNPECFISSGFMLEDIIMNIFRNTTKKQG